MLTTNFMISTIADCLISSTAPLDTPGVQQLHPARK